MRFSPPALKTTVGFDVAVFLAGSTFIVLTLRIIAMFMGHGIYDLVVLGACWISRFAV
jgi:hypothetical protein